MLKNFAIPQAFEKTDFTTTSTNTTAPSHEFLSNLLGIDQFLNDEGVEPEVRLLTETILKDCFTKDVILPLIKTFRQIIDEYLADESVTVSDNERDNLSRQREVFGELIHSYETSSNPQTNEETEQQNKLWIKLRDLGEVPPALVSRFESKLHSDSALSGIMPGLGMDNSGPSQCSII